MSYNENQTKEAIVLVYPAFVVEFGSNAGILASQLYYLCNKAKDGRSWYSDAYLTDQTGLNRQQLCKARKYLVDRGAITTTHGAYRRIIYEANLKMLDDLRSSYVLNRTKKSVIHCSKSNKEVIKKEQLMFQKEQSIYARKIATNLKPSLCNVVSKSEVEVLDCENEAETDFGGFDFVVSKTDAPKIENAAVVEKSSALEVLDAPTSKAPTPVPTPEQQNKGKYKAKGKTAQSGGGYRWDREYGELDLNTRTFTPSAQDSEIDGRVPIVYETHAALYDAVKNGLTIGVPMGLAVPNDVECLKELQEWIALPKEAAPF